MAVYFQVAGSQLALPDYARIDLAYTWVYNFGTPAKGKSFVHVVTGDVIEIPLSAYWLLTTSNQSANRAAWFLVIDPDGNILQSSTAAAAQIASLAVGYGANVGQGSAYGPVSGTSTFGFAAYAVPATYGIEIGADGFQSNDQLSAVMLTVIRIPTGPPQSVSPVPIAATPVLV